MGRLIIVAIGRNSLVKENGLDSIEDQYEAVQEIVVNIVDMVEAGYKVVITHGNGPQVGFGLRRSEIEQAVTALIIRLHIGIRPGET